MDNNTPDRKFQLPRLSSTSYVYPVKSLLEGRIQPAAESHTLSRPLSTSRSSDAIVELQNESRDHRARLGAEKSAIWARDVYNSSLSRPSTEQDVAEDEQEDQVLYLQKAKGKSKRMRSNSTSSIPTPPSSVDKGKTKETTPSDVERKKPRKNSKNYSHFPAGNNPYFPHTFSSITALPSNIADISNSSSFSNLKPSVMSADYGVGHRRDNPNSTSNPVVGPATLLQQTRHSLRSGNFSTSKQTPIQEESSNPPGAAPDEQSGPSMGRNYMKSTLSAAAPSRDFYYYDPLATPVSLYPGQFHPENEGKEEQLILPFNPSQYGLVHLPPLPSQTSSERASFPSSPAQLSNQGLDTLSVHKLLRGSGRSTGTGSVASQDSRGLPDTMESGNFSSGQSLMETSEMYSSGGTRSSMYSEDPHVTFRFRSIQDDDGNHVVLGREGTLVRCEDEPIRTPGAVQGFGVLIAIDEVEDTLVVRQVSENSTELLGLPPKYLFDLECFTDTLPEAQAGLLWDNIEFLSDPSLQSEDEESSPHVFLLSGWGAPGSAFPHEPDAEDGKRLWSCWCAVHRSEGTKGPDGTPGLIVMEFELEKDVMNPLYPPVVHASTQASGTASPQPSSEAVREMQVSPDPESDQSTAGKSLAAGSTPSLLSTCADPGRDPTSDPTSPLSLHGLQGDENWTPSAEDIVTSTTSQSRPLPALERLRRMTRDAVSFGNSLQEDPPKTRRGTRRKSRGASSVGIMDIFAVMSQINEQLGAAPDLNSFLNTVVGVIKDLTQFHRVMIYQFDEAWNGQVVAELVDWSQSHDLFRGLHFPASDIPAQARQLYALSKFFSGGRKTVPTEIYAFITDKVRLLYNCVQPTARIVARSKDDIDRPLDMTHCYLRAMSPIHITYLQNMGVRASMSISLMAFGQLWGLVTCHSYGSYGMRVSFPVRQMLRLLSQSISKNIERLSYAQRLHTRKLINTMATPNHPTGYIVSNADDLLALFDADFGILVIGEGAKLLGPNQHGQEILIMAEYLRLKQFDTIQASQAVVADFPDLELTTGFEVIAGLLYVPLSSGGKDFIAFLRKGQPRQVHWAGKPYKDGKGEKASLEPRKSFKIWSETIVGRSKMWTDDQLDTAGVLALVYGKFIEVWREKENALHTTKLTNLLLANASHEVRTPLNHIINYLEMAMNGPLDFETRDNLKKSHAASKSLLFTINDLLDLTRLESGNQTSFNETFDLRSAIQEATHLYRKEAERRDIDFVLDIADSPTMVVGDVKKIRTVVQNLTANALKYTTEGSITVSCRTYGEPEGLRSSDQTAVEILVADTGCGIAATRLESIFREFEHVEPSEPRAKSDAGVGLGLAVVARIVEQLGGQLRVDSQAEMGSRFSFLIPLALPVGQSVTSSRSEGTSRSSNSLRVSPGGSRSVSLFSESAGHDIDVMVNALASNHMASPPRGAPLQLLEDKEMAAVHSQRPGIGNRRTSSQGLFGVTSPYASSRPPQADTSDRDWRPGDVVSPTNTSGSFSRDSGSQTVSSGGHSSHHERDTLKVLIVEDNDINRVILAKRLKLSGHTVVNSTDGQEGLGKVVSDPTFDLVLMDIQMPIMNGFESTKCIRKFEQETKLVQTTRCVSQILNGRIPIFAVSASLQEQQRDELSEYGIDGWILKPIDFARLNDILRGVTDPKQRHKDVYRPGCSWEAGGWLKERLHS